jgi:hypothetical protein
VETVTSGSMGARGDVRGCREAAALPAVKSRKHCGWEALTLKDLSSMVSVEDVGRKVG